MIDKIKQNINIILLFIFAIVILYGIFSIILGMTNNATSSAGIVDINNDNVSIYMDRAELVKDYSTFFTMQDIIQNIISQLQYEQYDYVYNSFSKNVKNVIKKKDFLLRVEKYVEDNFHYSEDLSYDGDYINYNNLLELYKIEENNYVAIVTSLNESKKTSIGIGIISNTEYVITYLDI